MKPKCYVFPTTITKEAYEIDPSIWIEGGKRLIGITKYPSRIILSYIAYKMKAPQIGLPSRSTLWRHKKIWQSAGFL